MPENTPITLSEGISIISTTPIIHSKADEKYIEVQFPFGDDYWKLWIPIHYRRTGLFLAWPENNDLKDPENVSIRNVLYDYLNKVYASLPKTEEELSVWIQNQIEWWNENNPNSDITVDYFMGAVNNVGKWMCTYCLQEGNTNPSRRIQALKDFGYTLATKTGCHCEKCNRSRRTFIMMLPIDRDGIGNGYEQWTPYLRKRIISVLGGKDAYSDKPNDSVLPDHKFPEIRWDKTTKAVNPDDMPEEQIRAKFQLLTNQNNEAKREACRKCKQTGKRPHPYGIKFYYDNDGKGTEDWNAPKEYGHEAEQGCIGCCWYDFDEWRKTLKKVIEKYQNGT